MRTVPEPAASLPPGTWLGKHQLLHRLAVGGMAEIYLVRATGIEQFEKLLVLKRMLPQVADDHRFIRMFLDEARLAATFSHPNIAQVYDIGAVDGSYYFTMEYVHGEDLATVVRASHGAGRPIPIAQALTVVAGVAAGLHAAHEKRGGDGAPLGVVHRDVSPSNILVGYDGSVKVVDFGIAKVASENGRPGGFMGKLRYTSPEQARGDALDRRSDVFSLGVVLYELLTGRRPFDGEDDDAVRQAIAGGEVVAPSRVRAEVPAALDRIVLRALARERDARFATAQALQLAIEELARQDRLILSSVALADYAGALFGSKIAAWQEAQRAGRTLTDHMIATTTGGTLELSAPALSARDERPVAPPRRRSATRRLALAIAVVAAIGAGYAWLPSAAPVAAVHEAIRAAPPVVTPAAVHAAPPSEATQAEDHAVSVEEPRVAPVIAPSLARPRGSAPTTTGGPRKASRHRATLSAPAILKPAAPPREKSWDPDSPFEP